MANQYKNKIIYNGESLIDLTSDTVSAATLLQGETAHDRSGAPIIGNIPTKTSTDLTVSGATVTAPAGYYANNASKTVSIMTLPTAASSGQAGGYSRKAVISRSTGTQYINIPPGYNESGAYYLISATPDGVIADPVATKGNVDNNSVSITPSVQVTSSGYIGAQNITGTAVTVSASELVSGNKSITSNGTNIDVTNYATVSVAVGSDVNNQDKSVTPTESEQSITADSGYTGLGTVTVGAISSTYVGSEIDRRTVSNVTSGGFEYYTNGTYHYIRHKVNVESGYYENSISNAGYSNIIANITNLPKQAATTITPTESSQTAANANQWLTGAITVAAIPSDYVGSGITSRSSTDLTASGATVTAPAGYYANAATKTISTGTATAPASITGSSATVSTGTNTLTLTKSVNVTPSVTAGYIASGTAGNANVSLTASVTTKAAATITPGTSNQTIASGTYLTGIQTISGDADLVAGNIKTGVNIFGVAGSYTADATAAADDILSGQTAYVNGTKLTGTLEVQNYYTGSTAPSSSLGVVGDIYLQM